MIGLTAADRRTRDAAVLALRPPRVDADPRRPSGYFVEEEPRPAGGTERVATIFLMNRECPWRCVMCDLWKYALDGPTPRGAVPEQVRFALERLPGADVLKLYNAGSFFDRAAIPAEDHAEIARLARGFKRVVVECHPALVGDEVLRFRDLLGGTGLEVAMGLETAQEEILRRLNKEMTVAQFQTAARFLSAHDMRLRSFILLGVPFLRKEEWPEATRRSIALSFQAGAQVVSLIATRMGNGALEELQRLGQFTPPTLRDLEMAIEDFFEGEEGEGEGDGERGAGDDDPRGILLADLWDAAALAAPPCCAAARVERLRKMNLIQRNLSFLPSSSLSLSPSKHLSSSPLCPSGPHLS